MVWKYSIDQRVRVKTNNGPHKPPIESVKGTLGTIAQQSMSNWLEASQTIEVESPPSYYVEFGGGATELIGEDWLESI